MNCHLEPVGVFEVPEPSLDRGTTPLRVRSRANVPIWRIYLQETFKPGLGRSR